ncbi:MAG: hypothetical protein HKP36_13325 [Myxococcales bacterium]|nr:hypothetical protein [Deltaproteobacteria bacterium]NNL25420.1 hypothetical protein [Myxococcales bacterium]
MSTGQQLEAFSTTFGLVASLTAHLLAFAYISSATAQYDFDFALTLPTEVEFGFTGEIEMAADSAPPRATSAPDPRWAGKAEAPEAQPIDAGVPMVDTDAGADTDAGTDTGAGTDPDSSPVASPTLSGPSRIPPGAQLALRVDLRRVRESPLGPDVTAFLRGVPDWQLLLDGSGIDPVADLDRLLVATPNLQRSKLVLAGRHRRGEGFARKSVKRLARSRGRSPRWRRRFGIPTAAWHNLDQTPRTIALLSSKHFSITRRQDLERVLAIANARELRDANSEGLVEASGPDALLSMGPEEAVSLEIEGVHRFVIGSVRHLPIRLRVAVRETGADEATVSVLATYESDALAGVAAVYWKKVATFYSQQLIMSLAGFGKTLRRMDFTPDANRIRVSFALNADQIRFILSYAEGRLQGSSGASRTRVKPTKKGP